MSLIDVFVTPLGRYLSGNLAAATEPVGVAGGTRLHRLGPPASHAVAPLESTEFILSLRSRLPETLGSELPWREDGEVLLASRLAGDAWHALRAFAVDEYYPVPGFVFGPESHLHPGLERAFAGGRTGFRHLIRQREHQGFYLPTDFPRPFEVPAWHGQPPAPMVGSSVSLLRELNHLRRALGLSQDMGEAGWEEQIDPDDPLERVKSGWVFMRHCARLSVKHKLPMVLALAAP